MSSRGVREPDFEHRCQPARLPAGLVIRARHDDESQREALPRARRAAVAGLRRQGRLTTIVTRRVPRCAFLRQPRRSC